MFEDGWGYGTFLACQVRPGRDGQRKRVWNNPLFNVTERQNVRQLIRAEKSLSSEGTSSRSGLEVELSHWTGQDGSLNSDQHRLSLAHILAVTDGVL